MGATPIREQGDHQLVQREPRASLQVMYAHQGWSVGCRASPGAFQRTLALVRVSSFRSPGWPSGVTRLSELAVGAACGHSGCPRLAGATIACRAAGFHSCAAALALFGDVLRHRAAPVNGWLYEEAAWCNPRCHRHACYAGAVRLVEF